MLYLKLRLLFAALMCLLFPLSISAASRLANTTLTFPQEPYSYALEDAFPGIVFADGAVAMATPPGETNRLFVVEKTGAIWVISDLSNPVKSMFLNLSGQVDASGAGGALGLAFHPGYASNRLFFVYYTLQTSTADGSGFHDRLARFQTSPTNPNLALSGSEVPLITQYDQADNHNAGDLHFGPDGYLYVSLGDEGGGNGEYGNSRTITRDFFAGILRIDVDKRPGNLAPNPHPASSSNYSVPSDNPFVGATSFNGSPVNPADVRTEFWAAGMRNPWRFSFDPVNGRLFCGDVGESLREELNVIVKGGDYGWNYREGTLIGQGNPAPGVTLIPPILEYAQGSESYEGTSVVGGVVYRGQRIPELRGSYIFGDYGSGNIWSLQYDGTNVTFWRRIAGVVGVVSFGQDPSNGDILLSQPWYAPIQRLVRTSSNGALPARLSATGAFQNLATLTPHPGIVDYDINTPFWSDNAKKRRWFSVPELSKTIDFSADGNWTFPTRTVWVKHFDLELTNGVPSSSRRLETRFLVKSASGIYGLTYKWNAAQTDATLVGEDGADESISIRDGATVRTQVWRYPSRSECLACHSGVGGFAAGFNTHQLNRSRDDGDGTPVNQISWLSGMGYFTTPVSSTNGLLAYAHATNTAATVDHRVRSYLGANCSSCHQPGGTGQGYWDARLHIPWAQAGLINGPLGSYLGNGANRVIRPGDVGRSMLHTRISALGPRHMPPLATSVLDTQSIALLAQWISTGLTGAQITTALLGPDGRMRLGFAGAAGRVYRIEASANFGAWTAIGTAQAGADGTGEFVDPTVVLPGSQVRVYRCAWP